MKIKVRLTDKCLKALEVYSSKASVAKKIGITPMAIYQITKGRAPSLQTALKLMKFMSLKFEECFEVTDDSK